MVISSDGGFEIKLDGIGNTLTLHEGAPISIFGVLDSHVSMEVVQDQLVMEVRVPESNMEMKLCWEPYGQVNFMSSDMYAPNWINGDNLESIIGRLRVALNGRL